MPEPYTIHASCSCITLTMGRMALAQMMRERIFETIQCWRVSPEQEAMIADLVRVTAVGNLEKPTVQEVVDQARALIATYPVTAFCGFPLQIDTKMERSTIELVSDAGQVLARIVMLALPMYCAPEAS